MSVFNVTQSGNIKSEKDLRKLIPNYPKVLDKRIIPHLDSYCLEIIKHAKLVVLATGDEGAPISILKQTQTYILSDQKIKLQLDLTINRTSASLYFLVPGVGHGLRVNGCLQTTALGIEFDIERAYVHCSRAAVRSKLWSSGNKFDYAAASKDQFISESSFLLLKTMNKLGQTELSPRGDQPGFVQLLDQKTIFIPERPGNKVAVSLRNILQNSSLELLMMIPGSKYLLRVRGKAEITTDEHLLDQAIVKNKKPLLGIFVRDCQFELLESQALVEVGPWREENQIDDKQLSRFSKVLSTHMHGEGLLGKATVPIVQTIVNKDLNNLY